MLAFSLLGFSQSELVIELKTDNNPSETSWTLFDANANAIQQNGEFVKETTYRDTIALDDASCYYWTLFDSYGDGLNGGISPGYYKVYLNGTLIAESVDPNFGSSVSVYNMGVACSPNDVGVLDMAMLYHLSKDEEEIKAEILNMGVEPITSVELYYTVNTVESALVEVSDLSIAVGETYTLAYPVKHDFTAAGNYSLELTVTKVNGQVDENAANNSASMDVNVVDGYVQLNIIEDFMSYECGPCYDAAIKLDGTLEHFQGTQELVKYMMWDFADTKYFEKSEEIADYYRVAGVPHIRLNGEKIEYLYFTPTYYEDYIGMATPVKLTISSEMMGDSLTTTITAVADIDIIEDMVLRLIPMQNECYDVALNYDNNDPFYNVVYDLYNGLDGIQISELKAGEVVTFSTINSIIDYPFEEDSFEDMAVMVYLQSIVSSKIHQAAKNNTPYISTNFELAYNFDADATDIDTTGFVVTINSNRHLFKSNGLNIGNIKDHLELVKVAATQISVPFIASINTNRNLITVEPEYGWEANASYSLKVKNFGTIDGMSISEENRSFTTRNYTEVTYTIANAVTIYPNPAQASATIKMVQDGDFQIIDISGKEMLHRKGLKGNNKVDISNYNTGVYFVKVNTNMGMQIIKLIKQ